MKEHVSYHAIGSINSAGTIVPSTLTAAYSGNIKTLLKSDMKHYHLDVSYIPKSGQTNRYADILLEFSHDGTNFFPLTTVVPTVVEIGDYVSGTDSTTGIPIVVPGDKTSTGGTTYTATYDGESVADYIRISARESGTANFGTLYVGITISS
jgi:hypothetical protein